MPLLHLRGTGLGVVQAVLFDKDGTLSISEPQLLTLAQARVLLCLEAIAPEQRPAYLAQMHHLLKPGGWLLGLFWCHSRPGGPPYGSDPVALGDQIQEAGFTPQIWEPAQGSVEEREEEWLGLWQRDGERPQESPRQ